MFRLVALLALTANAREDANLKTKKTVMHALHLERATALAKRIQDMSTASNAAIAKENAQMKAKSGNIDPVKARINTIRNQFNDLTSQTSLKLLTIAQESKMDISTKAAIEKKKAITLTNGLEVVGDQNQDFRTNSLEESQQLTDLTLISMGDMNRQMTAVQELATEVRSLLEDYAGAFQEEQAETSAENVAFWAQEFQSVIENTQSDTTTLLLDIENIVSDVGGEHREIQQLLDQEKAELNGLFISLTEMADQVVDNAREQKAQMGPIEREELDGILKTTTAAAKAKNDIKAKALAAQNTAEKLLQEEKDDVVNDLEGQIRDFRGDANEVDKTNQEKADQLVATAKEITTDFRDEILATRKANAEVSLDTHTTLMDAQNARDDAVQTFTDLRKEADTVDSDSRFMLNDAVDEAMMNMQNARADLDGLQVDEERKLSNNIDRMYQSTRAATRSEQDKVEKEVDDKAGEVEDAVAAGTQTINAQQSNIETMGSTLGGEIKSLRDELNTLNSELSDASSRIGGAKESSKTSIENIRAAAKTAFGALVGSVEAKKADVNEKLNKEVQSATSKAVADQSSIEADLEQKIYGIRDAAESKLRKSATAISTATQRGETIAKEMVATGESIKQLKQTIEQDLPATKEEIESSIKTMKSQMEQVKESFNAAKTQAQGTVEEQNTDMLDTFNDEIEKFVQRIDTDLKAASQTLGRDVTQQETDIKGFKDSSAETYAGIKDTLIKAQTYLRETYVKVAKTVNDAETGSVNQNAEMSRMKNALAAAMNSLPRDAAAEVAKAKSELQSSTRKAKDDMAAEIERLRKEGQYELAQVMQESLTKMEPLVEKAKATAMDEEDKTKSLRDQLDADSAEIAMYQSKAEQQDHAAQAEVKSMQAVLAAIREKEEMGIADAKNAGDEYRNQLNAMILGDISQLQADEKQRLMSSQTSMDALLAKLSADGKQMSKDKLMALLKIQNKVADDRAQDQEVTKNTLSLEDALRARAQEIVSTGFNEIADVATSARLAESLATQGSMDAKGAIYEQSEQTLKTLGQAAMALRSAKQKEDEELGDMSGQFGNQLGNLGDVAKSETNALLERTKQIQAALPDLAGMFANDTLDIRSELGASHHHIAVAQNWTKQVIAGFEGKLEEVEKKRNEEAIYVHRKASNNKKSVLNKADAIITKVDGINKELKDTRTAMRTQLTNFRGSMTTLGAMDTKHDQVSLTEMNAKISNLEREHQELMEWKRNDKLRTERYRHDMEESLKELTAGIQSNDRTQQKDRIDDKLRLNDALRTMKRTVESELSNNEIEERHAYGSVTDAITQSTRNARAQLERTNQDRQDYVNKLREAYKEKHSREREALDQARDEQNKLDLTIANLMQEAKEAQSAVNGLALPMKSLAEGSATARQDNELKQRLANAASETEPLTGTSFMEESAKSATARRVSVQQTASETTDELDAVKSLNDELYRQNVQLEEQNKRLESGLRYAESLPIQ